MRMSDAADDVIRRWFDERELAEREAVLKLALLFAAFDNEIMRVARQAGDEPGPAKP